MRLIDHIEIILHLWCNSGFGSSGLRQPSFKCSFSILAKVLGAKG